MSATVVDEQSAIPRAKAACKRAAETVLPGRKVVVALVDDKTMAELHERFLGVPGPTDVLSFPHGEIIVSADTAKREAIERGIDPLGELVLYVVHGALHLAGHDDKKPKPRLKMRAAERKVLTELGFGDVFGTEEPSKPSMPGKGAPPRRTSARARKQAARKKAKKNRNRSS